MKGYRFYLEYPSKQEKNKATRKEPGNHKGTIVAVLLDDNGHFLHNYREVDSVSGLFDEPDSVVCFSSVGFSYLRERCKRVSEKMAREIHPKLFEYLDS